jgi:hypothetical protein
MDEDRSVNELRDEIGLEIERALAIEATPELHRQVWAQIERDQLPRSWWAMAAARLDAVWSLQPLVLALAVVATLIVGVFMGRRSQESQAPQPISPQPAINQQQLQFETPGGTRIIWTVNPDLKL